MRRVKEMPPAPARPAFERRIAPTPTPTAGGSVGKP